MNLLNTAQLPRQVWQNHILLFLRRLDTFAAARHKTLLWCLAICYKFALDALYIWAASPQYAYAGLVYQPSFIKYVLATFMYFSLFAIMPKQENTAAVFLLHLQFVFTVAPMMSFYALSGGSTRYMAMVFICVMLETVILCRSMSHSRVPIYIKGISNYVAVALGVIVLAAACIPILWNGFSGLSAFEWDYIYIMRENAEYPAGYGYILEWVTKAILPFAWIAFLGKKQYRLAGTVLAFQILFYIETGSKFTLLLFFPITAIWILAKSGHLLKLMYVGLFFLCIFVIVAYRLDFVGQHMPGQWINALIGIRALFHPADNKFNYYEFFSQNPKLYFSEGFLGKVFGLTYLYAGSPGQVIHAYNGGVFLSANMNTGYLGDSYAQLGFWGMLLMSLMLTAILQIIRCYEKEATYTSLTALFSVFMILLNDGALFTVMLSGGMLVMLLLVMLFLKDLEVSTNGI